MRMDLCKIALHFMFFALANSFVTTNNNSTNYDSKEIIVSPDNVFNGVYSECFLHLSYSCLQKKTLLYLKELDNLSEVSVIGDYVKFVRINTTNPVDEDDAKTDSTDELAFMIDKAVDDFFDNHVLKFNAMGRDISIPRNLEKFVGRKKRKGGGGGDGGMMGGHFDHDGGKKKMMMMAMMCMKMKLMMMVPAMMGMMGMMSFKGMMFSMMSFMLSKMMLLMKILEKKGGAGAFGGAGGGADGGWAAGGASGGAWMPAGGQDFGGGAGGGGYDANGQWQSRSIAESLDIMNKPTVFYRNYKIYDENGRNNAKATHKSDTDFTERKDERYSKPVINNFDYQNMPEISFVKPVVRFNNKIETEVRKNPILVYKKSNVQFSNHEHEFNDVLDGTRNEDGNNSEGLNSRNKRSIDFRKNHFYLKDNHATKIDSKPENKNTLDSSEENTKIEGRSRKKRGIIDLLQNSYMYWMNRLLGLNNNRRTNIQKYKIINGMKYVYYPFKVPRPKMPKEVQLTSTVNVADDFKPIVTAEDFNKGEIMEGAVESRMHRKKFHKMKESVNDTMEDNPWQ